MAVYVEFKERFHGEMMEGTYLRKVKSRMEAMKETKKWNALNPKRDKILVKKVYDTRPSGFKKTKHSNVWKKEEVRKKMKVRRTRRVVAPRNKRMEERIRQKVMGVAPVGSPEWIAKETGL